MCKRYAVNNYTKGVFKKFPGVTFEKQVGKNHIMTIDFDVLAAPEKILVNKYIVDSGLEKREIN